jgi:DNA mismatch repair protein MutL
MSVIRQLSPHVADLIAAGEVVERPASVVKELLENSFDAGAKKVTVEIQRGGMGLIRVTDDGCGMGSEDARTCFLRHATSKLRDEHGLEAIGTLGFRGEALAAIAAVSRVQLLTRLRGSPEGVCLVLEAGKEISCDPAGCPEGTTLVVRDLFYNTPARLKFMKKDAAETAAVTAAVIRCALSHPEVSLRYLHDGKEEFHTAGDGKPEGCVYTVLGRDFARTMLPASGSGEGITVRGFVCPPVSARGNRSAQYFFLNGRCIRSQQLQAALEQAYRGSLFTGRYPACVLFLTMKPNLVDVNVHPAKTEVRFLQERAVFDAVYRTVLAALQGEKEKPEMTLPPPAEDRASEQKEASRLPSSPAPKASPLPPPPAYPRGKLPAAAPRREPENADMPRIVEQLVFSGAKAAYNRPEKEPEEAPPLRVSPLTEPPAPKAETATPAPQPAAKAPEKAEEAPLPPYRILGEAFKEYIVVECAEELILIDKHAAHERMLFDKLKQRSFDTVSQLLLSPRVVKPGPEDLAILLENLPLLSELGVETEDFGGGALLVRQLPAGLAPEDADSLLSELAEALRLGKKPGSLGMRDEPLATMACKAAVKAGNSSDEKEWVPVAEAVLRGEVKYCPHGRPVTLRLTKRQLDRNFKRT